MILRLAILLVSGIGVGLYIASGASWSEILTWLAVGSTVGMFLTQRKALGYAYFLGYWSGRGDESVAYAIDHITEGHPENEDEARSFMVERQQVVAQQAERRGISHPPGWPTWDGIDRLSFNLPEEFHALLLPEDDEPPYFMRPPWWKRLLHR